MNCRDVTTEEREAAIFVIGLNAAFRLRGFPSSFPHRVFQDAVKVAFNIAGKANDTPVVVSEMDYPRLKAMIKVANYFGFDFWWVFT